MEVAYSHIQAATDALKQQMVDWADLKNSIQQNLAGAPTVVTLNVGGTTFQAFKDTLLRDEGSYFHALLGSGVWCPDSPGNAYFLDLDPDIFRHVFKFLRTGTLRMDGLPQHECCQLKAMMEYLTLDETSTTPTVFQWDPAMCTPHVGLSNDLHTVELLQSKIGYDNGAVAKSPLVGSLRLRVDCIEMYACIGVGPKASLDVPFILSMNLCYKLWSYGDLVNKTISGKTGLPHWKAGDVVTLTRTPSTVEFTINDGPTYPIELEDATEELFPVVFMSESGTKITILDATEA